MSSYQLNKLLYDLKDAERVKESLQNPQHLLASYRLSPEEIQALEFTPPPNSERLYRSTQTPEVRVGGQRARVLFSGMAAGLTGVWQIRFLVPEDAPAALDVPIRVRYNEQELTSVSVAVQ